MPRSASTLNQSALGYYELFMASGDRSAFDKCIDNFQQAVDLNNGYAMRFLANMYEVGLLGRASGDP